MNKKQSFTLIELLVVIAIVGILAAIIVISLGDAQNSAYDARRKVDINQLSKALMIHLTQNPEVSPPEANCEIGLDCPVGVSSALGEAAILKDPNSAKYYSYSSDGDNFIVSSELAEGTTYCFRSDVGRYVFDNCASYGGGTPAGCPVGWIEIPGTNNCVMKYEAKITGNDNGNQIYDSAFIADSRPSGTPWTNVTQQQARDECSAIGAHLITNSEWMTIARSIEGNASQNTVGVEYYLGNTDGQGVLAASSDDNDGYYGTGESGGSGFFPFKLIEEARAVPITCEEMRDPILQKRTLKLANGETIWDLSGNVSEWVNESIEPDDRPEVPSVWGTDFVDVINWKSLNSADFLPQNTALRQWTNKIGYLYCGYDIEETIGYVRGGSIYGCETDAGMYFLQLDIPIINNAFFGNDLGFRCVKSKP